MSDFLEALRIGLGFLWTAGWAIIMGLIITSRVQVYVSKERIAGLLGDPDLPALAKATAFGAARERLAEADRRKGDGDDPVCGMEGSDAYTLEVDGRTLRFCSEGCRRRFQRDPVRFVGEGPVTSGA